MYDITAVGIGWGLASHSISLYSRDVLSMADLSSRTSFLFSSSRSMLIEVGCAVNLATSGNPMA